MARFLHIYKVYRTRVVHMSFGVYPLGISQNVSSTFTVTMYTRPCVSLKLVIGLDLLESNEFIATSPLSFGVWEGCFIALSYEMIGTPSVR